VILLGQVQILDFRGAARKRGVDVRILLRIALPASLVKFTFISHINVNVVNTTNILIITPWIAETTLMRQEPGCNRQNLLDETGSSKTQ